MTKISLNMQHWSFTSWKIFFHVHGGLTTGALIPCTTTENTVVCLLFCSFSMTVHPCKHQTGPIPKKGGALSSTFSRVWWVSLPSQIHTWIWSSTASMRQAGFSSLLRVTSDEVPCGGSGVDSGGHDNASLLHKPGTFVFGENPCKMYCFHPAKTEDG